MRKVMFPLSSLRASALTGNIPNVHFCTECGALVTTEWMEMHREWHERLEGGS